MNYKLPEIIFTFTGKDYETCSVFEIVNSKLDTGNNIILLSLEKDRFSEFPEWTKENTFLSFCKNKDFHALWRRLYGVKKIKTEKDININNMTFIKILIISHYVHTFDHENFEYYNNKCKFHNLPPSLDKIYIPNIIKDIYTEDFFRLPYACEIVYYDYFSDIIELNKKNSYKIHFIEE